MRSKAILTALTNYLIRKTCASILHSLTFFSLTTFFSFSSSAQLFKTPDSNHASRAQQVERGGWGSSGDGGGIACFKNIQAAQKAEALINRNQILPQSLIAQILSLKTLDYWEWEQVPNNYPLARSASIDLKKRIDEVYLRMVHLVPLFVFRLEQAGKLIDFETWDDQKQVPRIYDAIPNAQLPKNCKQVQIVARYARENYSERSGPAKKIPDVLVKVNRSLFDKLDLFNQTILILHEQLYLLGQLSGLKNSDSIRKIAMKFFSPYWSTISGIGQNRLLLKTELVYHFGDYLNFFGEDLKFLAEPFSQESRFNSFYEIINKLREKKGLCLDGQLPPEEMIPWRTSLPFHNCSDYIMNPNLIAQWATDEMAFLYIANYILDISIGIINAEDILTPFADKKFIEHSENVMTGSCQVIQSNLAKFNVGELAKKADRYCRGFKDHLSPKGTDQN